MNIANETFPPPASVTSVFEHVILRSVAQRLMEKLVIFLTLLGLSWL